MHHFYPVRHLTLEQKKAICHAAKERCKHWWADELDCRKSFCRQRIEISFDEMMAKFEPETHFTIIHRKGDLCEECIEIAFRTMKDEPDYFLWIILDPSYADKLEEIGYV